MKTKKTYLFLLVCCFLFLSQNASANPLQKLYEVGVNSFEQGKYKNAISIFEKSLELYPSFAPAYNYLGLAHMELGTDTKEIVWLFEKAVEYNPEYIYAYDNLGKAYYQIGDYEKAEAACLKALELKPNLLSSNLSLAWIYLLGLSNPEEAINYFEKVLEVLNSPQNDFGLGIAYFMDDQRFRVMDIITKLKKEGAEDFAAQLENILRTKKFAPDLKKGMPLLAPMREASVLIDDFPDPYQVSSFDSKFANLKNMKVRLRGEPSVSSVTSVQARKPATLTGLDRIKQLQKNSLNVPEVKYYY